MNKIKKNLGNKISLYRKVKQLKQIELAEIIDMDVKNLSRIETGHIYPTVDNLEAISKALEVNVWQLFYSDNEISVEDMKSEIINLLNDDKLVISLYLHLKTIN
jgi:transcriptional regulator with XRE-family HTH domain